MKRILGVSLFVAGGLFACTNVATSSNKLPSAPVSRALAQINTNASLFQNNADTDFIAKDVIVDNDGAEHVRFDRYYQGLRVIGGDAVVHNDAKGALRGASLTLKRALPVDVTPSLTDSNVIELARREFVGLEDGEPTTELVVFAADDKEPALAYEVVLFGTQLDSTPSELHVLVNAKTGATLSRWEGIETASSAGTGKGFFSGNVGLTTNSITGGFELKDPSRGNQYTIDMKNRTNGGSIFTDADNVWGDNTLSNVQTVAVDAQYGTAMTWDYYLSVHGRNGIANDGVGAYNRVHYSRRYNNAFWSDSCFCMTYGDGDGSTFNPFDSLDVAGHEMSHGVTSRTAGLIYSGESGGINEANSDIFGAMVEFYANNASDPGDYLIGEKLYKSNPGNTKALRFMYRPSKDGFSKDCWSSTIGSVDVHYSSGVGNHFFYLLAEGSGVSQFTDATGATTCNGSTVTGIGRDAAAQIWYRALTVYMTSSTNYAGARAATLSAASDLFGASSAQRNAVAAAWSAVGVN